METPDTLKTIGYDFFPQMEVAQIGLFVVKGLEKVRFGLHSPHHQIDYISTDLIRNVFWLTTI